jgi:hypothetical protein
MANIIPDGWREMEVVSNGAQREIETLARLAEGLSEDYTVYHAVHWTNVERGYSVFGEVDFVIVNRAGDLLFIEQKSGYLTETDDGLVKQYSGKTKSVPAQMARAVDALRHKMSLRKDIAWVHIDSLLYCPDYTVKNPAAAGISAERIIDNSRRDSLVSIITQILPPGEKADTRPVHNFLRGVIQLEADVSAMIGRARSLVTRISGGLASWARQLEFEPFHLRVTGTAGSGKTQLALAEFNDALAAGRRPLYVCFNRPLADHFASIVNDGGVACTFHALCETIVRAAGEKPDFSRQDAFTALVDRAAELPVPDSLVFDIVIVDEGQDFSEAWRDMVFRHLQSDAKMIWLEDPLQNLYGRPSVPLPGWVGLRSLANYRSPREVVRLLQPLLGDQFKIQSESPFKTGEVEFLTYQDAAEMLKQVKAGIRNCFSAGFRKDDIAVITWHGREHSDLLRYDRLGDLTLRTFTGEYDLFSRPVYGKGDILMESVYRFKGQAAPAVVLAEIDFDELDDRAVRKLFVGATRAMMKLVLVISEKSAAALLERMNDE